MSIYEKVNEIGGKKVFETGDEKQFIRAKDIDWLINEVICQQGEIQDLRDVYDDRCEDINFYVDKLKEVVNLIEAEYTEGEMSMGENTGFTKLLSAIYSVAKDSTTVEDFKFM